MITASADYYRHPVTGIRIGHEMQDVVLTTCSITVDVSGQTFTQCHTVSGQTHRVGEVQVADLTWYVLRRRPSVDWGTDPWLLAGIDDVTLGEKLVEVTVKVPADSGTNE